MIFYIAGTNNIFTQKIIQKLRYKKPTINFEIYKNKNFENKSDKEIDALLLNHKINIGAYIYQSDNYSNNNKLQITSVVKRYKTNYAFLSGQYKTLLQLPLQATLKVSDNTCMKQTQLLRPDLEISQINITASNTNINLWDQLIKNDGILLPAFYLPLMKIYNFCSIDKEMLLPMPGNGALYLKCRTNDDASIKIAKSINNYRQYIILLTELNFANQINSPNIMAYTNIKEDNIKICGNFAIIKNNKLYKTSYVEKIENHSEISLRAIENINKQI